MTSHQTPPAIVLESVGKSFKKMARRKEFTTIKSELVRMLSGKRQIIEPSQQIEALTKIDLVIPRGKTVGIVGRNGSGKSTLLKLITGIYTPTRGKISVNGRISALLELGAGFHPDFTGRENIIINGIILGMSHSEVKGRVNEIIEFAELGDFIDEPVRTYSSGMFMRLAFAVATHVDPDILIIDEILSVGDEHFQRKSQAKMNEFRRGDKTIVLVTHGLGSVESWCDLAVWIDGGQVRMAGDPREVVKQYRRAIAAAEAEGEKTGHSALSAPGLALPQTQPIAPSQAPASVARLTGLRLKNGTAGDAPTAFASGADVTVLLDWQASQKVNGEFVIDLCSADGRLLFSTTCKAPGLEGTSTARLSLERLGLGEGLYEITATLRADGVAPEPPHRVSLRVAPDSSATGVLRLAHRWSLTNPSAN